MNSHTLSRPRTHARTRLLLVAALSFAGLAAQAQTLLNASYDVAR